MYKEGQCNKSPEKFKVSFAHATSVVSTLCQ
jgi:hypothetical protein